MNTAVSTTAQTTKAKLTHRNVGATAWNKDKEELVTILEVMKDMGSIDKQTPCDLYRVENKQGQKYCVKVFHLSNR